MRADCFCLQLAQLLDMILETWGQGPAERQEVKRTRKLNGQRSCGGPDDDDDGETFAKLKKIKRKNNNKGCAGWVADLIMSSPS